MIDYQPNGSATTSGLDLGSPEGWLPRGTRCLVTGGAGFIGSHIVERLVELGHRVRVVDDLSSGDLANLRGVENDIEFQLGSLCDPNVSRHATTGMEIVFHLAALPSVAHSIADPWAAHEANLNATIRLLEACRGSGVRRVVYSSSSSVYGDSHVMPKVEDSEPLPCSPYATQKLASEQYVLSFARAGLLEGVALRYFNIFGPRQSPTSPYAAVIPLFLEALTTNVPAIVYGDGLQTRDFTYVDNVVIANLLAASRPAEVASGTTSNVGAGERTSLLDLLTMLGRVSGRAVRYEHRPARVGDVRDSMASLERARTILGYRPVVRLEEGVRRTWDWFAAQTGHGPTLNGLGRRRAAATA